MPLRSSGDYPGGCCLQLGLRGATAAWKGSVKVFPLQGSCGSRCGSSRGASPARGCKGCRGCWGSARMGSGCSETDRESAPGCAACPCGTSCRGRGCVYAAGYRRPLRGPQALLAARSDRRTDANAGTARLAGAADAARGLGRRGRGAVGGRDLFASGRGSESRTCAQAQPSGSGRNA